MNKYVYPLEMSLNDAVETGVGVFIDDMFITAGHVIKDSQYFTLHYNGQMERLYKEEALLYGEDISINDFDIAIFKQHLVKSPLRLSPTKPDVLQIIHCIGVVPNGSSGSLFNTPDKPYHVFNIQGKVQSIKEEYPDSDVTDKQCDYYILCKTDEPLKRGYSGSPILNGNVVYGFLIGSIEDNKGCSCECFFQSSYSILKKLHELKKKKEI